MSIYTSVLTGGDNDHETTSEEVNGFATDAASEGVVGTYTATGGVAPMTGNYSVNSQSPDAMAVDVSSGIAYVNATPTGQISQNLRIRNTGTVAVTIAANSSGSTKYDWVYIKVDPDNAADPAVAGDDVATLVVSRSTSSVTDNGTPPTYGLVLAVVTVANGASSIADGSISDRRTPVTIAIPDDAITTDKIADEAVTDDKWVNGVAFHAYRNASKTITSSIDNVGYDTEVFDIGSDFAGGIFTAPVEGIYHIDVNLHAAASAQTRAYIDILCSTAGTFVLYDATGTDVNRVNGGITLKLVASETVTGRALLSNSADVASTQTWISGFLVTRT